MEYENHKLKLISDFPIKVIREDKNEIDLIINLDYRCLNLNLPEKSTINSRIQFTIVKGIMIRYCKDNGNNIATIHFMKDSGLHSTMANFELNYLDKKIIIKQEDNSVEMFIE